jgi:hypothetical protein
MYFTMVYDGADGAKHGGSRGAHPEAVEAAETEEVMHASILEQAKGFSED